MLSFISQLGTHSTDATPKAPAPKDKSVSFSLPEMKDAMDASKAASSVLIAVSAGELTPLLKPDKIMMLRV